MAEQKITTRDKIIAMNMFISKVEEEITAKGAWEDKYRHVFSLAENCLEDSPNRYIEMYYDWNKEEYDIELEKWLKEKEEKKKAKAKAKREAKKKEN